MTIYAIILAWWMVILPAAAVYDLDPMLVAAIIEVESQGQHMARGAAGEVGLMQIMPFEDRPPAAALDVPWVNVFTGARILRECIDRTGSVWAGLGCDNGDRSGAYAALVWGVWRP